MTKNGEQFTPRLASFFSGIGGFDLGFEQANYQVTMQCEIDAFGRKVLNMHWPEALLHGSIKELKSADIPVSDVWAGGFPCQDVSLARMGQRAGLKGAQSGLFHDFARLLGESLPRVVVIENVPGLLSSHGGRDFGTVIQALAELGYAVGWRTLNSKYFNVPQSRDRVFIVGCYRDATGPSEILFEPERGGRHLEKGGSHGKAAISPFKKELGDTEGEGPVFQELAYCLYATSARHTGTDWSRTYVTYPKLGKVRRLTAGECEGIQGFPAGWTMLKNYSGDFDKLESARYKSIGNAVTVGVARWLAERIDLYLQNRFEASVADEQAAASPAPGSLPGYSETLAVAVGEDLVAAAPQGSRRRKTQAS
ncbi:DNA cytosine methyltransferase [Deinococcus marmoris]|uniref:DNA cytosine methyltransferase n=1 Tax=Deinococcus marmoris TaxID=249408 RepID=UPI00096A49C0|nr:DNA (cytosine-5-)-methyltransferase [Deinococcus marmoris]